MKNALSQMVFNRKLGFQLIFFLYAKSLLSLENLELRSKNPNRIEPNQTNAKTLFGVEEDDALLFFKLF